MRELHVVAVSEDGRHVVLAGKRGATTGGFRVALDDRLAAALRGDLPRPGQEAVAAPELSPKEIQARLRAGESADAIAASAGVPISRVQRFAGPVQGEMARMIDAARAAYLVRGRLGRSAVPVGDAVDAALALTPSLVEDSVDWSTHRLEDGSWQVTVSWFARKRTRTASWRYDPAARTVTAVDAQSAALGFLDPAAPPPSRRPAAPAKKATAKAPAKKAAARAPGKKAAAKAPAKKAAAKAPAKKAPATKAPAKKAAATKAPAKQATRAKAAGSKAPAAAAAAKATPAKGTKAAAARTKAVPTGRPSAATAAAAARRTGAGPRRALRVVPDPAPVTPAKGGARAKSPAERDGVRSRASVPAWADVLLGTSPGGER